MVGLTSDEGESEDEASDIPTPYQSSNAHIVKNFMGDARRPRPNRDEGLAHRYPPRGAHTSRPIHNLKLNTKHNSNGKEAIVVAHSPSMNRDELKEDGGLACSSSKKPNGGGFGLLKTSYHLLNPLTLI